MWVNSSVPGNYVAGQYVPGLGDRFYVDGKELNMIVVEGSQTATAVAAGGNATITVDHSAQPFNFNTVPVVSTSTPSATVEIVATSLTLTSFQVLVNNTSGASQDVVVDYTRNGL